jgi:hypothetical protein
VWAKEQWSSVNQSYNNSSFTSIWSLSLFSLSWLFGIDGWASSS